MAEEEDDQEQEGQQLNIIMPPEQMGGVWANFAMVRHSEHEFTLDFVRLDGMGSGIVVARVGVSPLFITQLVAALNDNWAEYAKKAMPKEVYEGDEPDADDQKA